MRKYAIYIILLGIILIGIIISQGSEPEPIDWTPTFSKKDKIPFGTRIFYDLLKEKYNFSEFQDIDNEYPLPDSAGKKILVNHFIVKNEFAPDESEVSTLLHYADNGNNVFISANGINSKLADTLKIAINRDLSFSAPKMKKGISLVSSTLKSKLLYYYNKDMARGSFSKLDSDNISILGRTEDGAPDFIRIRWGIGNIFVSAVPYCFTNAGMLTDNNAEYAEKCLAYLPAAEKVYWYEDQESSSTEKEKSLLSFIFSQPSLRWAYWLLIISLIVYVFFEGKRRQKIIPIIVPLKNSTIEFAETIGRLYFHSADHKNLAEKKISYFYEFLRNRLYIKNIQPDDKLYFRLSTKTGIKESEIKELFDFIMTIKDSPAITETSLINLNTLIDNFYKHF